MYWPKNTPFLKAVNFSFVVFANNREFILEIQAMADNGGSSGRCFVRKFFIMFSPHHFRAISLSCIGIISYLTNFLHHSTPLKDPGIY